MIDRVWYWVHRVADVLWSPVGIVLFSVVMSVGIIAGAYVDSQKPSAKLVTVVYAPKCCPGQCG